MIIRGIDEAGLGPTLGPFCSTLSRFHLYYDVFPEGLGISKITKIPTGSSLPESLRNIKNPKRNFFNEIQIADSKLIFSGKYGFNRLESNILPMLEIAGMRLPCSFKDFLMQLCSEKDIKNLHSSPWFSMASDLIIPRYEQSSKILLSKVKKELDVLGLKMEMPLVRVINTPVFNNLLDTHHGKGGAVMEILAELLLEAACNGRKINRIFIDRLGGRRYYCPWLSSLFRPVSIICEKPEKSSYKWKNAEFHFLVRADRLKMECAWASMLSKYVRENSMYLFNSWWRKSVPDIRPTAGYPQDAKRFISHLKTAGQMPRDESLWIRRL